MASKTALRIPSLDGLRAISIASVLTLHLSDTKNFLTGEQVKPFNFGYLGVRVFFVISGFLITSLLLEELASTGRISLKQFYLRRTIRIFPCLYAYLLVVAILAAFGILEVPGGDMLRGLTYTVNYAPPQVRAWPLTHLWSLSVEEQFYLLWPAMLAFGGKRRGLIAAGATLIVCPLLRVYLWVFVPAYKELVGGSFETVADALATGCLLAGCRQWLWDQPWYRGFLTSRWMVLAPLAVGVGSASFVRPRIHYLVGQTLLNVGAAICIDWAVRYPETIVGRVLNWRPLAFIGVLSYSLYIWQQVFCVEFRYFGLWWSSFPVNLVLSFLAAVASYKLVEQPFLRLRKYFADRGRAAAVANIASGGAAS